MRGMAESFTLWNTGTAGLTNYWLGMSIPACPESLSSTIFREISRDCFKDFRPDHDCPAGVGPDPGLL